MVAKRPEILEWASRGTDLLSRAQRTLSEAPSERIQSLANRVPTTISSGDGKVKVVFAGQYSAGKSTILRALTGREDVAVGAGITTDQAYTLEWDGIEVVDTPGVHTEIRPHHDEITYRAIAEADLLVFVVTNELFDSHLAEHFQELAIERDKAHEMMLVVNKMRRSAGGNSPEQQSIIREDLRKMLRPFSPEQLRISFTDAEAALESKTEEDEVIATTLWEKSGFRIFVDALNQFVREKRLTGRFTTALYNLEQVLQEALTAESSDDKDVAAIEELLLQRRRALVETQQRIPRAVEAQVSRTASQVREDGRKVTELLHSEVDFEEANRELRAAQERAQEYSEALSEEVHDIIVKNLKDMDDRVGEIANSELARELLPRLAFLLQDRVAPADISPEALDTLSKASNISRLLGDFFVRNSSFDAASRTFAGQALEVYEYIETPMYQQVTYQQVTKVDAFFGHGANPFTAEKWSRRIANVGRGLAVAGALLTLVLQIREDRAAAQRERDQREIRSVVRDGFNEAAHAIETHYDRATDTYVTNTLENEIETIDEELADLRDMERSRGQLFEELNELLNETRSMIHELHIAEI
jgi:small GTP-binding protein